MAIDVNHNGNDVKKHFLERVLQIIFKQNGSVVMSSQDN